MRNDIKKILVLGSGALKIGEAVNLIIPEAKH